MCNYKQQKRQLLSFRHFCHKGYALFACIGREVKICVLSVSMLTFANVGSLSAQQPQSDSTSTTNEQELSLGEVVIKSSRVPTALSQSARMVMVLSRSDVEGAAAQSVNDLLKKSASVDVRQRGAIGAQTDISIRGGTHEQITLLINGIDICDPQTGHNTFALPIDLSEIERIELLESPGGRTFGASSLVGAINIITHLPDTSTVHLYARGGSYGYAEAGGRTNWAFGKWNQQISGSYTRSDGYSRAKNGQLNADFANRKIFYQGNYEDNNIAMYWHAGIASKDYGSNTFYSAKYDTQFEHLRKTFAALRLDTKGKFHVRPSAYWNRSYDRFELIRGREDVPYNYHCTNVFGLNLNNYFSWAAGHTAFGAEFRNEDIVSTTLGEPLSKPKHISDTHHDYTRGLNRTNLGFHLEHNFSVGPLQVSAGGIAVKNTLNGTSFKVYPGADAALTISENWKVLVSYSSSLRTPTFTELYYSVGGHQADKYLKPEKTQALQGGIRYGKGGVEASVEIYYRYGKDMIDWIRDLRQGNDADWVSVNHTKVKSLGLETDIQVDAKKLLPHQQLIKKLRVGYAYISQAKKLEPYLQSQYALEYLRNKLTASLALHLYKYLNANISCRYQERIGTYQDIQGTAHTYTPYTILDGRLSWDAPHYAIYLEGNNLLNRTYYDYGNVPQPGIWLMLGFSTTLGLK